jgi:hypothetical protein
VAPEVKSRRLAEAIAVYKEGARERELVGSQKLPVEGYIFIFFPFFFIFFFLHFIGTLPLPPFQLRSRAILRAQVHCFWL